MSVTLPRNRNHSPDGSKNAMEIVSSLFKGSKLFGKGIASDVPSFNLSELSLGGLLGMGEFCIVQEISRVSLSRCMKSLPDNNKIFSCDGEQETTIMKKTQMAKNSSAKKGQKYAIKFLHKEVAMIPSQFQTAILDLTVETTILSILDHPNIVKLYGFNKQELFRPGYFIILEQLDSTLHELMQEWINPERKKSRLKLFERGKKNFRKPTLQNKINIISSVFSALSYLHERGVVHRDMKPDNIGFDYKGEAKIFDFGLATVMSTKARNSDGLYLMTGNTGSRRYMAPEIAREEAYNELIDVYSMGIMLWEMIAEEKAFDGYSLDMHEILIVQIGNRPDIDPSWPEPIRIIIQSCWSHDYKQRPSARSSCLALENLLRLF